MFFAVGHGVYRAPCGRAFNHAMRINRELCVHEIAAAPNGTTTKIVGVANCKRHGLSGCVVGLLGKAPESHTTRAKRR